MRLVTSRQRVGLASAFDVERARTQASSARAAIPPLETLEAVSRHRVAVLIGDQAANADAVVPWTGVAWFPKCSRDSPQRCSNGGPICSSRERGSKLRTGGANKPSPNGFRGCSSRALFGHQHVEEDNFDLESARFSNVAGLLTMPILNWGRTRGINEIAESAQVEALLHYEDQIVRALEDVENALVALREERVREDALQNAAAAADAALGRAQSLYDRGQIDLLPLLDAERTRLAVRVSAIESHTRLQVAAIALFKALGGGWESFESTRRRATADRRTRAPNGQSVATTYQRQREHT